MAILNAIIFLALGLSMLFSTHIWWRIDTFLLVINGEPTRLYLIIRRFIGGVLLFVGIIFASIA